MSFPGPSLTPCIFSFRLHIDRDENQEALAEYRSVLRGVPLLFEGDGAISLWYRQLMFSSVARLLKIPGRRRRASDLEEFSAHFSYHLPDLQKTKVAFEKDAPGNQEKWLKQREKWCKQIEKVTDSAAPSWFYIDWYMNLVGG